MTASGAYRLLPQRKAAVLLVLLLSIFILILFFRFIFSSFHPPSSYHADRVTPIDSAAMPARGSAQEWKSSAEIRLRGSSPVPVAGSASAVPSAARSDDFLPWVSEVSVKEVAESESPLPSTRNEAAIPHHPAQMRVPALVPPALRSDPGASWRPTDTISVAQATAARQRIAQGEKIFKRGRDSSPGILDAARGRKVADRAISDASQTMHGGVQ